MYRVEDEIIEFPRAPVRKRGRPRGKPNPLDKRERRRRNAEYERERRALTTACMNGLGAVLGLKPKTKAEKVVGEATRVVHQLTDDDHRLAHEKKELESENAKLQAKLKLFLKEAKESQNDSRSSFQSSKALPTGYVEPPTSNIGLPISSIEPSDSYIQLASSNLDCTTFNEQYNSPFLIKMPLCNTNILSAPPLKIFASDDSSDLESLNRLKSECSDEVGAVNGEIESDPHIPSSFFDRFNLSLSPSQTMFSITTGFLTPPEELFEPDPQTVIQTQ